MGESEYREFDASLVADLEIRTPHGTWIVPVVVDPERIRLAAKGSLIAAYEQVREVLQMAFLTASTVSGFQSPGSYIAEIVEKCLKGDKP